MNRIEQLRNRISEIDARLDAILAADQLDEAAQTEHDALVAEREATKTKLAKAIEVENGRIARDKEAKELDNQIEIVETALASRPRGTGQKTKAATDPAATKIHTDTEGRVTGFMEPTDEEVTLRFGESRDAQVVLSRREQRRLHNGILKRAGYQPWGEFKSFSEFVQAGFNGHQTNAFRDRVGKHYAVVQGMSEGVGQDGGYLVMPEFATGIIDRIYGNDLWGRTDNYSVTGNQMTFLANAETSRVAGSRAGGMRGYWLAEGASLTKSKPTFREVTVKLVKLGVLVYLTDELVSDGGGILNQYVSRKANEEFNFMLGDSLINGTGVGQPLGVLNAPSLLSIAKETGQAANTIVPENCEKMYARFYPPNVGNMVWTHNVDIRPQLNLMTLTVGTGGVPVFMPMNSMSEAPHGSLLNRPLLPTEFNATLGTQGDIIAADFGQILSINKGGVAQAVSMHVEFLTDQLALRFILRVNATPWETAALTPFKGSNTQSSFITLDSRA